MKINKKRKCWANNLQFTVQQIIKNLQQIIKNFLLHFILMNLGKM